MRHRRSSSPRRDGDGGGPAATPSGASSPGGTEAESESSCASSPRSRGPRAPQASLLRARTAKDFLARCAFVGIFITENILHSINFDLEIDTMVAPALAPLPREVAVCLHIVHIVFGLFGASFVIISGFDTAGRTALTKGTSMMIVFMSTITWTWWINRNGVPYWDMDPYPFWDPRSSAEKRNRTVHMLKNLAIVGALTMLQQMAKYEQEAMPTKPSFFEGMVTALRPWSFTSTLAPLLVALSAMRGLLRLEMPGRAEVLALMVSIMAVQAAANLVNSYFDFKRGVDTADTAGDRTLVDGLVSPTVLKVLSAIAFVWWSVYFVWSAVATNFHPGVLGLAAFGTFLAVGYTAGPAPLKNLGLGDVAVFIAFGPALIAYTCTVLTGAVQWQAVVFSMPVALYVVATLHANNYRDIQTDRIRGVRTFAVLLGPRLSLHYYTFLLLGAHLGALAAGYWFGCAGCLGSLCVVPQTMWLYWRIRRKELLRTQDEETAKSTLMFGVALALGIITMPGQESSRLGLAVCALLVAVLKVFTD